MFQKNKTSNSHTYRDFSSRFLRFAASVALAALLLQPLAALADDPVVLDGTNTQNPPVQNVQAGATNDVPVVTQANFATSTPDSTPTPTPITDPTITSTPTPTSTSTPSVTPTPTPTATSTPSITPTPTDASSTPATDCGSGVNSNSTTTSDCLNNPANPGSPTTTIISSSSTLDILTNNNLDATTTSTSTANTGLNDINAKGDIKYATTTTGDVNVYANVLTVANINLVNSQITEMNDSFNKLAADLYLNQPELSSFEKAQDLVSPICSTGKVSCQSITTFKLSNQNTANVDNTVGLNGNTGGNQISATGDGDVVGNTIATGNVNAVVNILNIVNANAVNSRWTIVTFNVFGGWKGDLVLPSELYFSNLMSVGSDANSDINQVQKIILNVNNTNQSNIANNVTVQTDTGSNVVQAIPDAKGASGDVKNIGVATGNTSAAANVQNVSNVTVYNSSWFLGLINIMGTWSGHIYSLPSSVNVNYNPNGFTFVSSPDPTVQAQLLAQLQAPTTTTTPQTGADPLTSAAVPDSGQNQQNITDGADGSTQATSTDTTTVSLDNSNTANINNDVTVNATTGANGMSSVGGDIKDGNIMTGNATALANILNFANANFINSDLYVGLVNVFGDWQGNIVFGYPDLSVSQDASQPVIPGGANQPVNVNVNFANQGDGSAANSQLEWKYDPTQFSMAGVNASTAPSADAAPMATTSYQTLAPGDVQVDLGKLSPNQTGTATFHLKTVKDLTNGAADNFSAHIFALTPETALVNNQGTITVKPATGTPVTVPTPTPTPVPTSPPSGGGGAPSGGSPSGGSPSGGSPSGGSPSGSPSGSGGTPPSQAIGVYPNILRIYKVNTAAHSLKPGDSVHFKITLDNDGNNTVHSLVAYDTLKGPDGTVVTSKTYTVPDMATKQEFVINYDVTISSSAASGVYTNSAYAQGLNDGLQLVRTQFTANSSFTVVNPNAITSSGANALVQNPNATTTPDSDTTAPTDPSANFSGLLFDANGAQVPQVQPKVLGAQCVQPTFKSNLQVGSNSNDVKTLQVYLNKHGYILTKTGAGSPGHETTLFGSLLRTALTKYQKAKGIKERGVFGTETRNYFNNLFNTTGADFCPPPAPVSKTKTAPAKPLAKTPVPKTVKTPVVSKSAPVSKKVVTPKTTAVKKATNLLTKVLNPIALEGK